MTASEIAELSSERVRNDETLMRLYIEKYRDVFFSTPNCAPCTFDSDFARFKTEVRRRKTQKQFTMAKTFQLKRDQSNVIHTYRIGKVPHRSYGYNMTEEFAKAYLKEGTKEQIAERKKLFTELPESRSKSSKKKSDQLPPKEEETSAEVAENVAETPKEGKLPRKKKGRKPNSSKK